MKTEDFATGLRAVMEAEGVTAEALLKKAPLGFWPKVADRTGMKPNNARIFWTRNKPKLIEIVGAKSDIGVKPDKTPRPATVAKDVIEPQNAKVANDTTEAEPGSPVNDVMAVREELLSMMTAMETRLTTMLEERITAALTGTPAKDVILDEPPRPAKEGKKFKNRKVANLRGLIDASLYALLEKDAKDHYGENMSRTLEAVLWRYYCKPRLSFQEPEE